MPSFRSLHHDLALLDGIAGVRDMIGIKAFAIYGEVDRIFVPVYLCFVYPAA
jgi:hypothetical protein